MLSEFEADTAEYILVKFAMLHIFINERKYGLSVRGELQGHDDKLLWTRYRQIVADTRVRLQGCFICGQVKKAGDGYTLTVELY